MVTITVALTVILPLVIKSVADPGSTLIVKFPAILLILILICRDIPWQSLDCDTPLQPYWLVALPGSIFDCVIPWVYFE